VTLAVAMGIDVAAVLGPSRGDELAATFRIAFVPGGDVTDAVSLTLVIGLLLALA
jgi:hypothetical protein